MEVTRTVQTRPHEDHKQTTVNVCRFERRRSRLEKLVEPRLLHAATVLLNHRTFFILCYTALHLTLCVGASSISPFLFWTSGPVPGELPDYYDSAELIRAPIPRNGSGKPTTTMVAALYTLLKHINSLDVKRKLFFLESLESGRASSSPTHETASNETVAKTTPLVPLSLSFYITKRSRQ